MYLSKITSDCLSRTTLYLLLRSCGDAGQFVVYRSVCVSVTWSRRQNDLGRVSQILCDVLKSSQFKLKS